MEIIYRENVDTTTAVHLQEGVIDIFIAPYGGDGAINFLMTVSAAERFAELLQQAVKEADEKDSSKAES